MAINNTPVSVMDTEGLLSKFPAQHRDKLRLYTGEELFYAYKLATFKPKPDVLRDEDGKPVIEKGKKVYVYKPGDVLYMALKKKLFRWLKNEACDCHKPGKCVHRLAPKSLADLSCDCEQPAPKLCQHGIAPSAWQKLGAKFRYSFSLFVEDNVEIDLSALEYLIESDKAA